MCMCMRMCMRMCVHMRMCMHLAGDGEVAADIRLNQKFPQLVWGEEAVAVLVKAGRGHVHACAHVHVHRGKPLPPLLA